MARPKKTINLHTIYPWIDNAQNTDDGYRIEMVYDPNNGVLYPFIVTAYRGGAWSSESTFTAVTNAVDALRNLVEFMRGDK